MVTANLWMTRAMVGDPSITDSPEVPSTGTLTKVNNGEGSDDRRRRKDSDEVEQSHWEQSIADCGPTCTRARGRVSTGSLRECSPTSARRRLISLDELCSLCRFRCAEFLQQMPFDISQIHAISCANDKSPAASSVAAFPRPTGGVALLVQSDEAV
jgi:hypothetical protein